MAKRKKRAYYDEEEEFLGLNPETKRAIFTILIFTFAILSVLSIFDMTGSFGRMLNFALAYVFGLGVWLFVIILLWLGYLLIKSGIYGVRIATYIGFFLMLMSFSGILHLFVDKFTFSEIAKAGKGGGALGYLISHPGIDILGIWGTSVILASILFIGMFLGFNTSFSDIIAKAKVLGIIKEKFLPDQEYEEEEDEEQEFEVDEEMEEEDDSDNEETEEEQEFEVDEEMEEEDDSDNEDDEEIKKPKKKIVIPIDLLSRSNSKPDSGDVDANMNKIQKTFENFGIEVSMSNVNVGPTVTQYTLRPAEGVRLSQMLTLQNDLALALAAHPLRMEAPIPGKSLVGVEVPNKAVAMVKLREVLESNTYKKRKNNLQVSLGKDVAGESIMGDLPSMPHLLIAGSTGSGKSVCINNVILSLIYQNSPDELKFILIDPKRVELAAYNDIPHLLTPVINDTDKAINALRWVVNEMHERYKLLQASGKRNVESYNKAVIVNKIPYIVVVVDEFAALMSLAAKEIEAAVVSLAQMARAVGIHLILATQRPSVDVITGLIKANITSRIAFAVASSMDSRTIIDASGAEKLLGKGDMLFMTADLSKPRRIQGAYVSDEEINDVVAFIKENAAPEYNESIIERKGGAVAGFGGGDLEDDLALEAKEVVIKAGKASATLLQRRLRVGYARAARLLDILEEMGVVSPSDGPKAREVLVSQEDLENNFESVLDEEEVDDEQEDLEDGVDEEDDEELK